MTALTTALTATTATTTVRRAALRRRAIQSQVGTHPTAKYMPTSASG